MRATGMLLDFPWREKLYHAEKGCKRCGGDGYTVAEDGARPCPDCMLQGRVRRILRVVGIPRLFEESTVAGYKAATALQKGARTAIVDWVRSYQPGGPGLYLHGPVGTGKTHLACALLKGLAQRGVWCLYRSLPDLLHELRRSVREENESDLLDALADVPVLLLDDLGSERLTEYAAERLHQIVDDRYADRRTTLVTSNLSPAQLGRHVGQRMASRLMEMTTPLRIDGRDHRAKGLREEQG